MFFFKDWACHILIGERDEWQMSSKWREKFKWAKRNTWKWTKAYTGQWHVLQVRNSSRWGASESWTEMLCNPELERKEPHTFVPEALWTKEMCSPDQSERPQKKSRCEGLLTWLHWQRNYENSCGNYNSARPWRILSPTSPSAGYSFSLQLDQWFCLCALGSLGELLNFLMLRLHSHPHHLKWLPGGLAGIGICSRPPRSFQNVGTIELD